MIKRTVSKLKQNGFRWFVWRLMREVRNPSILFAQKVIDKFLRIRKILSTIWCKTTEEDILYAIYDLDVCAVTFNIVEFIVYVECVANEKNKKGFVVVIVPPSNDPNLVWDEYDSAIDVISRRWRFQNIVVPLTSLSEKCKGTHILSKRSDVIPFVKGREVYPELYDGINLRGVFSIKDFHHKLDRPHMFEGLRASMQGLRYIQEWVSENRIKDPIVTISLRDCEFDKVRNSNVEAWSQFAIYLRSNGYYPVVIPDTDTAFVEDHRFDGIMVFKECAWNIGLRMSLHESAFLNFFVDHGCSALATYNPQCKYIRMNEWTSVESSIVATDEAFKETGMGIGDNYKFATPGQWLCYKPDSFENIVSEFERFVREQKPSVANEASSCSSNQQIPG